MVKAKEQQFLVLVDASEKRFLLEIDGQVISTTTVPSVAASFDYKAADALARQLQRRRHRYACVSDLYGRPVTGEMLDHFQETESDSLPKTREELARISVAEQRRRYKSDPAFRQRFDELEGQRV